MILNNAKNLMLGSRQIERIYRGTELVWGGIDDNIVQLPAIAAIDNTAVPHIVDFEADTRIDAFSVDFVWIGSSRRLRLTLGGAWNDTKIPFCSGYINCGTNAVYSAGTIAAYNRSSKASVTFKPERLTFERPSPESEYMLSSTAFNSIAATTSLRGTQGVYPAYIGGALPFISAQQTRDGVILHDWIPAKKNGVLGVYDKVEKTFNALPEFEEYDMSGLQ